MTSSETDRLLDEILRTRITILVGHFGSGKTEIAVNLAYRLRQRADLVTLVDLDIVKPYFRSRGLLEELEARGIQMVAPRGEFAHADLPIVVPEVRAAVGQASAGLRQVLIDVGGAEVGARVLGSIPGLEDPATTDVLFVVNGNRPFAETTNAVLTMLREIERVSRLTVRGLVANTHLMDETTVQTVLDGVELAASVGRETGLPVRFCGVRADLLDSVRSRVPDVPLLPVERHIMPALAVRRPGQRRRSSVL
jgi:Ni2+-binding GTPase involved in maturation of urease and hydrogenase